MKQVLLILITIGLFYTKSMPQSNQYGLTVINTIADYKASLRGDSSNQMVSLDWYLRPLYTNFLYATDSNFTHTILYQHPHAFLRKQAAEALQNAQSILLKKGLAILIWDAYRPYSVTEKMWQIVPDDRYAANPAKGSGHNRGIAVDITLIDTLTGLQLPMPTTFDSFSEKAHHSYLQLDSIVLQNRELLKTTMQTCGFVALPTEWWHYYLPNAAEYELLNLDFDTLTSFMMKR